jgi:signal transduction histidine kinase
MLMSQESVQPLYQGKVLVVEDDAGFRSFLCEALNRFGQKVTSATNGRDAIDHINRQHFDLVLTDLWMPDVDGLGVLAHVVKQYSDTPVVIVTAHGDTDYAIKALRSGAYDFILKPINGLDFLYRSINRALERHQLLRDRNQAEETIRVTLENQTRELRRTKLLQDVGQFLQGTYDEQALLHMILTAVTSGFVANYNRAAIFLLDSDADYLSGRMAMGPVSGEEAGRIWESIAREDLELRDLMHRSPAGNSDIARRIRNMGISAAEANDPIVARLHEKTPARIDSRNQTGDLTRRVRDELDFQYFVAVPLLAAGRTLGVIIADNRYSGHAIDDERLNLLILLANQAAMALDNVLAYNRLAEQFSHLRQTEKDLIQSERMAAIGRMAAQIAHEIRNPLVSIGGFARRILLKYSADDATKQACGIIVQQVCRLEASLRNITNFAGETRPEMVRGNINAAVQATRDVLQEIAIVDKVKISLSLDPHLPETFFDPSQIQQVLLNVGKNGIEAMESGGTLSFRTGIEGDRILVTVEDTGKGMNERALQSAFDPFFTTKSIGTGLGLAVTRKIVLDHGGDIEFRSNPPGGTQVRILLPLRSR